MDLLGLALTRYNNGITEKEPMAVVARLSDWDTDRMIVGAWE